MKEKNQQQRSFIIVSGMCVTPERHYDDITTGENQ